jgi:hypothetical protein
MARRRTEALPPQTADEKMQQQQQQDAGVKPQVRGAAAGLLPPPLPLLPRGATLPALARLVDPLFPCLALVFNRLPI